ncbi:MAG: class I SAM-dependent methyltransferase [Flavisolibacter sp.]
MLREFIASQFRKPSGPFGIFTSNLMIKGNRKNYETMIDDLNPQPQEKLLEIGYGPGLGIRMIAETCSGCTIDGIDFSQLMYKRAGKYNRRYIDEGRVLLSYGDFLQAPLTDNSYDKIFCLNVIYFWDELNTPFKRVHSLLKQNGSFHIYMADKKFLEEKKAPDSVFNKYSVEETMDMLTAVGFNKVHRFKNNGHFVKAEK